MRKTLLNALMLLSAVAIILTACTKKDDFLNPMPGTDPQPGNGFLSVRVKAAITIGDVLYDSIPATLTITSWDVNNSAHQKDTTLNAGAQTIYLPKEAVRYSLKMQKWGATYEKLLNRSEITEGDLYQLGGHKEAKKLQWVTEERFENGNTLLSNKQQFIYDVEGRINEIHLYATDPATGQLLSGSSDLFLYDGNELWINNILKSDGTLLAHGAYTFDTLGRISQSKYQYRTETQFYTNYYTSEGIMMLMGKNATDLNGSRIALKFAGGNRVEEKTIITNTPATIKNFTYDFNINPYVIIKMPGLYFDYSSKNNVVAESWEGIERFINEYTYDAEGYVTEVTTKIRNNNGVFVNFSRTIFSY